jgi:hypothetical protein
MKKIFMLYVILLTCNSCSEFVLFTSGTSIAVSQSTYAKAYSGVDFLTVVKTEKDIKTHTYEKVKKVINDE